MKKILVVEDDPDIRELLTYNLQREGFEVVVATNGSEGFQAACKISPDLMILDLMLPELNGIEVCKKVRATAQIADLPVIMLTAKGEETDIVYGLGIGADDYMVKPFSIKELVARVYTRLRTTDKAPVSAEHDSGDTVRHGVVELDRARFQIKVHEQLVPMTLAEFRLFDALVSKPGIVLSRDRLLDAVTGGESVLIDRNIDVHIRSIRKKLGPARDIIETVRGLGYKFRDAAEIC